MSRMPKTGITVGQLIDLIDYNRDYGVEVLISEYDDNWNVIRTDTTILDRLSDCQVDSISADEEGRIKIWLHDNAVCEYREEHGMRKVEYDEDD